MKKYMVGPAMRFFFLFAASVMWLGIGLTGFSVASWVLYVPAGFFTFAALTGICPGLIHSFRVLQRCSYPGLAKRRPRLP